MGGEMKIKLTSAKVEVEVEAELGKNIKICLLAKVKSLR